MPVFETPRRIRDSLPGSGLFPVGTRSRVTTTKRSSYWSYITLGSKVKVRGVKGSKKSARASLNNRVPPLSRASIIVLTTAMTRSVPTAPIGSGGIKRFPPFSVALSSKLKPSKVIPITAFSVVGCITFCVTFCLKCGPRTTPSLETGSACDPPEGFVTPVTGSVVKVDCP